MIFSYLMAWLRCNWLSSGLGEESSKHNDQTQNQKMKSKKKSKITI